MSTDPDSPVSRALCYISNDCFHRRFTLPATADHGALTVSYADVGRSPSPGPGGTDANPPTVLLIPGMFPSRYLGIFMHAIAEKLGVRVLVIDRPGSGASTNVPLEQRLAIWLEVVPLLLAHRGIEHVALVSHSAGAIYLLNTLYHYRSILHPDRPFVALLAPWVDPSHSHVTSMQMARYIPETAFSIWNRIPQFFLLTAGPAIASSGTVVTKLSNAVSSGVGSGGGQDSSEVEGNRRRIEEEYDLARDVQAELDSLMFKFMFAEDTVAANDEALQCLKKGGTWGRADDYEKCVRELVEVERRRVGDAGCVGESPRLKVRTYFGESDSMIGKTGQKYVEQCWRGKEDGEYQDVLDFQSMTVSGTDHDSLVQSVKCLERVFVDAGGSMGNDAVDSR